MEEDYYTKHTYKAMETAYDNKKIYSEFSVKES